jgi:hypothetical protein
MSLEPLVQVGHLVSAVHDLGERIQKLTSQAHAVSGQVQAVSGQIQAVAGQVDSVGTQVSHTDTSLQKLWLEFRTFVDNDRKAKNLQLAETRQVKIRQELEQRFGHHDAIRRLATGVLQAADLAVVRQETLHSLTETVMVQAPGYWLPPALLALTAWFGDQRDIAERALAEAQRRDADKTSLFFALVCRRAGRQDASAAWLARFFQRQQPAALERGVVVLIDAMACGLFGLQAQRSGFHAITAWLSDLQARAGFAAEQHQRWAAALVAQAPTIPAGEFPLLRQHSSQWPELETCLSRARRHAISLGYFQQVFAGPAPAPASVAAAIDDALSKLVTHFDPEEAPLRSEERRLALIIATNGDTDRAQRQLDAEMETHQEKTDFAVLLTGAAMHPEVVHASLGTQRLAIALSQNWISAANEAQNAQDRLAIPNTIALHAGSWKGVTRDGADEAALVAQLDAHYQRCADDAAATLPRPDIGGPTLAVIFGLMLGFLTVYLTVGKVGGGGVLVAACGFLLIAWGGFSILERRRAWNVQRDQFRAAMLREGRTAKDLLKGLIAEVVTWRRLIAATIPEANALREYLSVLHHQEHLTTRDNAQRSV